ncbi:hypothetical protein Cni_G07545 [Canna indica]|uniref:Uncharacterized protein n=1 Tax=Canna indica TaxID=4628 RepID=A0AAQ3K0H2_9LILI|nr:hypothetical protein Cni_G07545 [Canna indica]
MPAFGGEVRGAGHQGPSRLRHARAGVDRAMAADRGAELRPAELGARLQPGVRAAAGYEAGQRDGRAEQERAEEGARHLRAEAGRDRVPRRRQGHSRRPLSPPQCRAPGEERGVQLALHLAEECFPVVGPDIETLVVAEGGGDAEGASSHYLSVLKAVFFFFRAACFRKCVLLLFQVVRVCVSFE